MYVERINLLCTLKGLSKSKLAKELGISKQLLSKYIQENRIIDDIVRLGICRYFEVPEKIFTQHEIHLTIKGNKLIIL